MVPRTKLEVKERNCFKDKRHTQVLSSTKGTPIKNKRHTQVLRSRKGTAIKKKKRGTPPPQQRC